MAWYFIGVNNIENYIMLKEIQNLSSHVETLSLTFAVLTHKIFFPDTLSNVKATFFPNLPGDRQSQE